MTDRTNGLRVAVLASGSGSNFQALVERFGDPASPVRVALLVASKPEIGALERASRAGVPATVLPEAVRRDGGVVEADFLLETLREGGADLVVLAGWLRLVPFRVVATYRGRMLNIHPALLPAFGGKGMYGRRVHRAVLESGARVTGATVHLVDEEYDRGPIVAQWPVPVLPGDDEASLAARVLAVEHRLLPAVVAAAARRPGRLAEGTLAPAWLEGERFCLERRDGTIVRAPGPVPARDGTRSHTEDGG